jgi:AcrR family transcriptional regulator
VNENSIQSPVALLGLGDLSGTSRDQPDSAQFRITSALLRCVGRWGLSKTTIEDVAKEAGVSRATVYRLFPGGKNAIMQAAVLGEVRSLLAVLTVELAQVDQVEDCLTVAMHHSAQFLEQHQALSFMRDHESGLLDQLISAEQLDLLFVTAAQVMKPVLSRFMDEATAIKVGMWVARLVVSYVAEPSAEFDLCKEQDSRRLVRMFLLPGISTASLTRSPT